MGRVAVRCEAYRIRYWHIRLPVFGSLSDRIGRRPIYLAGAGFLVLFAFPYFLLLQTEVVPVIWAGIIVGYILAPTAMFAVQSVFFTELFGTRVRYSGLSVEYQVSAIAGGFVPLIATFLLAAAGGKPWFVATLLLAISLLSLVCTYLATETFRNDISKMEGEIRTEQEAPASPTV